MNGKDDRHKEKRSNMRHHKKYYRKNTTDTGASSSQVDGIRGVIDVADSSDDRIIGRPISWSANGVESEIEFITENDQMRASDFELLTQISNSAGGHFQFSSEKNWDSEDVFLEKTEASEYFTFDSNLLNVGLQTIPFYKRLDLSKSWFTKTLLKIMNTAAENAEKQYQIVLKEHENNHKKKSSEMMKGNRKLNSSAQSVNSAIVSGQILNDRDSELDELLTFTTNKVGKVTVNDGNRTVERNKSMLPSHKKSTESEENREGIQQWLDDVLEE